MLHGMVTQYALLGHVFCGVEITLSQFLVDVRVHGGVESKWGYDALRKTEKLRNFCMTNRRIGNLENFFEVSE